MKKRGWVIAGCIFIFLILFIGLMQIPPGTFSGKRFTINKETTFLTEPLRADGGVDYAAALNQIRSADVTPESNAVVGLLRVFGNERNGFSEGGSDFSEQFAKALGIDSIPFEQELIDASYYVNEKRLASLEGGVHAESLLQLRMDSEQDLVAQPWKSADLPDWAEALEKQQAALDTVVAASKRPHYYHPLVLKTESGGKQAAMVGGLLPIAQSSRHAIRQLAFRAMNSIGEGRMESAIEDIQAMRRLSCLTSRSSTLLEKLISIAGFGMTLDAEEKLLRSGKLSRQQLADYQTFLKKNRFTADLDQRINHAERFFILDHLTHACLYGPPTNAGGPFGQNGGPAKYLSASADLSEAMRVANQWMDRQVEALQKPTMKERVAASNSFEVELEKLEVQLGSPMNGIRSVVSGPASRGRFYGEILVAMMAPAVSQVIRAENRTAIHDSLVPVAFALELYRSDKGEYPDSLNELSPDYLESMPMDELNEVPLVYSNTATGFLLYSIGIDGVDQGGRIGEESESHMKCDIRICVGDPPEPHPDSPIVRERTIAEAESKSLEQEKARRQAGRKKNEMDDEQ